MKKKLFRIFGASAFTAVVVGTKLGYMLCAVMWGVMLISVMLVAAMEYRSVLSQYKNYKECFGFYQDAPKELKWYYRNLLEERYQNGTKSKKYHWIPQKFKREIEDIHLYIQEV